ncbi:MAG: response regulator transcription factor [Clostridia bacterium]|nr:response regulator transcription factor [Clostridia bacterium]
MRIIIAEDERDLASAIKNVLEYNHYDVDVANDGESALEMMSNYKYDGAILDIMMPKMDGITVVKELRAGGNNIPVLILTAKSEVDDKVLGLDAGADDYLTKPFVIKELLARVRALTRRTSEVAQSFSIGNTTLDHQSFELCADGKRVRLTAKEYKLMEHLIRNKNMLLSTEKLMESIWGYDSDAEINVVWVFISALRKKLETIGSNYSIKAVRGVGYKLEELK